MAKKTLMSRPIWSNLTGILRGSEVMEVEAVVFDYDGTLVQLNIDFDAMRTGVDRILESYGIDHNDFSDLYALETIDRASKMLARENPTASRLLYQEATDLLMDLEVKAAKRGRILPGVVELLSTLKDLGVKVGIITRNCDRAVRITFPKIEEICDVFLSRNDISQVKPHPAHVTLALRRMGVKRPRFCVMVGDHVLDIEAGKQIGMKTAGVLTGQTTAEQFVEARADFVLEDATKVLGYVLKRERGVENRFLRSGKLDIQILEKLLKRYALTDQRVLIGPRIGEDTAAIDMGEKLLIVTTDPITFATDEIGYYGVVINANDIATSGAEPKWFTANILLPERKTDKALVESIFQQIQRACEEFRISLIGGHTEITHGLDRPILIGHMMGEVGKEELVTTGGARTGDDVLLSKGICIEGTSIIAREKEEDLFSRGVSRSLIKRAKRFLYDPGISVIREARMACETGRVHSMHDVTEGGLANGLHEIAFAAQVEVVVEMKRIPIFEESRVVCEALGLDPLGVIASGALLLTTPPAVSERILDQASHKGVAITRIGHIQEGKPTVSLITPGGKKPIPYFFRDEVTKVFEKSS
jgi:HAD superfamily hydrolase (TIGR01509 family)